MAPSARLLEWVVARVTYACSRRTQVAEARTCSAFYVALQRNNKPIVDVDSEPSLLAT